jgi:hypothetical protein
MPVSSVLPLDQFFHVYVLTLKGWEDRLERFKDRAAELGVTGYTVLHGVDGMKIRKPNWWKPNARKYACNLAHMNALHAGIMAGGKPIMILEDDCYLRDNFIESVHEVIAFFRDVEWAKVCYLGGRVKRRRGYRAVSRLIYRNVRVTGAYGYVVSESHAPEVAGYIMNDPGKPRPAYGYFNDIKMRRRAHVESHVVCRPPALGHSGGMSILQQAHRSGRDVPSPG